MNLVEACAYVDKEWENFTEDLKEPLKVIMDELGSLSGKNQHLINNIKATGEILLTGREEGDPVFDQWAGMFTNSPDALPHIAKSVMEQWINAQQRHAMEDMMAGESENGQEAEVSDVERILAAFSEESHDAIVIYASGGYLEQHITIQETVDLEELGLVGPSEEPYEDDPEEANIWVWEGRPVWDEEEGEVDFTDGIWRRPTFDEWQSIIRNKRAWAAAYPEGVPAHMLPQEEDREPINPIIASRQRESLHDQATDIGIGPLPDGDEESEEE
jgi:hypothetical protein